MFGIRPWPRPMLLAPPPRLASLLPWLAIERRIARPAAVAWENVLQVSKPLKPQLPDRPMKMENAIRILAGTMVLISVTLTHFVSPWWLLLAVFVGVNLIQSALTGFCPAELILRRLGVGKGQANCCGS
jgi:hypothetical protein